MKIHFTKMHGCGNDYVYISGFDHRIDPETKPELVRKLSDRHFGIGGDGVIFINPSEIADFEMEMWNADGTRGEMCGNGIRCVGKFVYDKGMTDKTEITVESFGKIKMNTMRKNPVSQSPVRIKTLIIKNLRPLRRKRKRGGGQCLLSASIWAPLFWRPRTFPSVRKNPPLSLPRSRSLRRASTE